MSGCANVCRLVIQILQEAGYPAIVDNADHKAVLEALSDYRKKHDEMLEHILMQQQQ